MAIYASILIFDKIRVAWVISQKYLLSLQRGCLMLSNELLFQHADFPPPVSPFWMRQHSIKLPAMFSNVRSILSAS